jgi:integrase
LPGGGDVSSRPWDISPHDHQRGGGSSGAQLDADECSFSTVKNSSAVLVRVLEQAVRDGVIDRNPARVTGWQHAFRKAEDELDDPRSLALPDWMTLRALADALVAKSADRYTGWDDVVIFAACTGARIGEVPGCRVGDIDPKSWLWTVRRQTTPSPGWSRRQGDEGQACAGCAAHR